MLAIVLMLCSSLGFALDFTFRVDDGMWSHHGYHLRDFSINSYQYLSYGSGYKDGPAGGIAIFYAPQEATSLDFTRRASGGAGGFNWNLNGNTYCSMGGGINCENTYRILAGRNVITTGASKFNAGCHCFGYNLFETSTSGNLLGGKGNSRGYLLAWSSDPGFNITNTAKYPFNGTLKANDTYINLSSVDQLIASSVNLPQLQKPLTIRSDDPKVIVWFGEVPADGIPTKFTITSPQLSQEKIHACLDMNSNGKCDYKEKQECGEGASWDSGVCCTGDESVETDIRICSKLDDRSQSTLPLSECNRTSIVRHNDISVTMEGGRTFDLQLLGAEDSFSGCQLCARYGYTSDPQQRSQVPWVCGGYGQRINLDMSALPADAVDRHEGYILDLNFTCSGTPPPVKLCKRYGNDIAHSEAAWQCSDPNTALLTNLEGTFNQSDFFDLMFLPKTVGCEFQMERNGKTTLCGKDANGKGQFVAADENGAIADFSGCTGSPSMVVVGPNGFNYCSKTPPKDFADNCGVRMPNNYLCSYDEEGNVALFKNLSGAVKTVPCANATYLYNSPMGTWDSCPSWNGIKRVDNLTYVCNVTATGQIARCCGDKVCAFGDDDAYRRNTFGAIKTGSGDMSSTYYCTANGTFTSDLDTTSQDFCTKAEPVGLSLELFAGSRSAQYKWTGSRCCGEPEDVHEYYNDGKRDAAGIPDAVGACWNTSMVKNTYFVNRNTSQAIVSTGLPTSTMVINGSLFGCSLTKQDIAQSLLDSATGQLAVKDLKTCAVIKNAPGQFVSSSQISGIDIDKFVCSPRGIWQPYQWAMAGTKESPVMPGKNLIINPDFSRGK